VKSRRFEEKGGRRGGTQLIPTYFRTPIPNEFQKATPYNAARSLTGSRPHRKPPREFLQFCSRSCPCSLKTMPVRHGDVRAAACPPASNCTGLAAQTEKSPRTDTTISTPGRGEHGLHHACLPGTAREFPATPVFPNAPSNRPRVRAYTSNAGASTSRRATGHKPS
jgi:hypothetical protein